MEHIALILLGISVGGFVVGLAGKAQSIKRKSINATEIFTRITTISLILMFVFMIVYLFFT